MNTNPLLQRAASLQRIADRRELWDIAIIGGGCLWIRLIAVAHWGRLVGVQVVQPDKRLIERGLARAVELLREISPGIRLVGGVADQMREITAPPAIELSLAWLERKLGRKIEAPEVRRILESLRQLAGEQVAQTAPVLLCSTPARFHLRRLLEPFLPKVVVLSPLEIPPMVPVQSLGTVR